MAAIRIAVEAGENPRGFWMDLDPTLPNERTIAEFLYNKMLYEPDVSGLFLRVLRQGDGVIDIGGNVGWFALLAAALVGPTGRVVTFEPGPDNLARLRRNIALNGFDTITVVDKAVTDHVGEVAFYLNSDTSGGNALWDPAANPDNRLSAQNPRRALPPLVSLLR